MEKSTAIDNGKSAMFWYPRRDSNPKVSIDSPANASTVARKSNVTIATSASDNVGVARVEFLVNGVLQCSDVSGPYSNSRVPPPPNKAYQIQARAFDAAGNSATAAIQVTSR